jgi:hypothetical protein
LDVVADAVDGAAHRAVRVGRSDVDAQVRLTDPVEVDPLRDQRGRRKPGLQRPIQRFGDAAQVEGPGTPDLGAIEEELPAPL